MKSFLRHCLGLMLTPLLLALPACQRPEEAPQPADLIPREKMIRLLADLHVLEARVESSQLQPDSARALFLAEHKNLLWRTQVTDSAFQRSYRYYGIHGKDLDEIYKAVIDTLGLREQKLDSAAAKKARVATPAPTPLAR
ncbi:DUF4296 domain-containing protein [Hymenobacter sp. B1770]|uniref:DUF4296 domain-containing protein n=1 Tax=Hymenobacter sp. B1770 TaxID=1718788 RepID=UPI003CEA09B1